MVQVEMLVHTYFKKPIKPGDVIEVSEYVAKRWEKNGIAKRIHDDESKMTEPPKKKGRKKNDTE